MSMAVLDYLAVTSVAHSDASVPQYNGTVHLCVNMYKLNMNILNILNGLSEFMTSSQHSDITHSA